MTQTVESLYVCCLLATSVDQSCYNTDINLNRAGFVCLSNMYCHPSLSSQMDHLMKSQPFPLDGVPHLLQCEEAFHRVESLFHSASLQLLRQADKLLLLESKEAAGFQALTMCIAVQGLARLTSAYE